MDCMGRLDLMRRAVWGLLLLAALPLGLPAQAPAHPITEARTLLSQGAYDDAAAILEFALRMDPTSAEAAMLLGMCYTALGRYEEAESRLETADRLDPRNPFVQTARGNLSFAQNEFARAIDRYRAALALDPTMGDAVEGLVAAQVNLGVLRFRDGRANEAEALFLEALDLRPQESQIFRNLGLLKLRTGSPEEAAVWLRRAVDGGWKDAETLGLLVSALRDSGQQRELVDALEEVSALLPYDPRPQFEAGLIYESLGQPGMAKSAFERAVALETDEPYPYFSLAQSGARAGEPQVAIALARQAVGKAVRLSSAMRVEAARVVESGDGNLGREELDTLKALSERAQRPLSIIAQSLDLLEDLRDDPELFEADLKRFCDWYPNSLELRTALGVHYEGRGMWQEALAEWETLLEQYPAVFRAHAGRGLAQEGLGDSAGATLSFLKARDLEPEDDEIYEPLIRVYRSTGGLETLEQILSDRARRETRNVALFVSLVELQGELGDTEGEARYRAMLDRAREGQ
jgi:tetratricopeptide (TPR) repeat protein